LLRDFVADLRRLPPLDRPERDMARMLAAVSEVAPATPTLPIRAGGYTRTCAFSDDRFEVLLLDWAPGAASEIHDHGGQHCWFVVLQGSLRVDDYRRLDSGDVPGRAVVEAGESRVLASGDLDLRSGKFDLHRVSAGDVRAVSLHVYARPLQGYLVYDRQAQRCRQVSGAYDRILSLFAPTRVVR
jgi:cysteine dioxygenase